MKRGVPGLVWSERGGVLEAASSLPDGLVYRVVPSERVGTALVQGRRQSCSVYRVEARFESRIVVLYDHSLSARAAQDMALMHEWNRAAAFHWDCYERKRMSAGKEARCGP